MFVSDVRNRRSGEFEAGVQLRSPLGADTALPLEVYRGSQHRALRGRVQGRGKIAIQVHHHLGDPVGMGNEDMGHPFIAQPGEQGIEMPGRSAGPALEACQGGRRRSLRGTSERKLPLAKLNRDPLHFGHFLDGITPALAPEAAVLYTAERHMGFIGYGAVVDVHHAGLEAQR